MISDWGKIGKKLGFWECRRKHISPGRRLGGNRESSRNKGGKAKIGKRIF